MSNWRKEMTYEDAKSSCHVRSAIYRKSHPDTLFAKNHTQPFDDRVPADWQKATDWLEWDPQDEATYPVET